MPVAVKCNLFLYADNTCLVFQSKNVKDIEKQLNEDFVNICDWLIDNKLSIHFGIHLSLLNVRSKIFRS